MILHLAIDLLLWLGAPLLPLHFDPTASRYFSLDHRLLSSISRPAHLQTYLLSADTRLTSSQPCGQERYVYEHFDPNVTPFVCNVRTLGKPPLELPGLWSHAPL